MMRTGRYGAAEAAYFKNREGKTESRYPRRSSGFPHRGGSKPVAESAGNASLLNRIETHFQNVISAVDKNF
jgi:hypothetical protein